MSLIPETMLVRLLANGADGKEDHVPVVKLFHPLGPATWLLSELNPADNDTAFALGDLGVGCPELGLVSLAELESIVSLGHPIRCDLAFVGRYRLSVYAEAAHQRGAITTIPSLLDAASLRLAARRSDSGLH